MAVAPTRNTALYRYRFCTTYSSHTVRQHHSSTQAIPVYTHFCNPEDAGSALALKNSRGTAEKVSPICCSSSSIVLDTDRQTSYWGARWRGWLRRCVTSRKVADSILEGVIFSSTQTFRPHHGPAVDSSLNRNEYHEHHFGGKGGRCLGLTTLSPSCASTSWIP